MDLNKFFIEAVVDKEREIKKEIKKLFKGDSEYDTLKANAKKKSSDVPTFLDYVYSKYDDQIEKLSKKYKIGYEEVAGFFIEV